MTKCLGSVLTLRTHSLVRLAALHESSRDRKRRLKVYRQYCLWKDRILNAMGRIVNDFELVSKHL